MSNNTTTVYSSIVLCIVVLTFILIMRKISGEKGTWSKHINPNIYMGLTQKSNNIFESKGETECRRCLEIIFKKPFPKVRPDFLKNPKTGHNLELDCYNDELKIAVEYNGIQHYKQTKMSQEDFHEQQYRDNLKKYLCKKQGIVYIEVPYTVKVENIHEFLLNQLYKANY